MEKNKPISLIHTPCKMCVFANYRGDTQIGCDIGYLDKYRKNNIEILEAYDSEKNFYIINNKKCLGFRNQKWLEKHKSDDHKLIVKQENSLSYICLIALKTTTTIDQIRTYINSIMNQEIRPKGILLYKNRLENHLLQNKDILNYMENLSDPVAWRIKNFIDKDMSEADRLRATIASCPINRFYLLANLEKPLAHNCIGNIQSYIDDGHSFGCVNIQDNKFFSYVSVQYCKNIKHIDLLSEKSLHTLYETIS